MSIKGMILGVVRPEDGVLMASSHIASIQIVDKSNNLCYLFLKMTNLRRRNNLNNTKGSFDRIALDELWDEICEI